MAFSEKRYLNRLKFELKRRGLSDEILKDVVEAFDSARECGESPEAVAERLGTPAAFAESFGGSKARSVHVFAIISAVFIIIGIVLTVAMSLSNGVPSDAIGFAESGTNIYLNGSSVSGILLRILPFALAALFALTEVIVTILTLRKRKNKNEKI